MAVADSSLLGSHLHQPDRRQFESGCDSEPCRTTKALRWDAGPLGFNLDPEIVVLVRTRRLLAKQGRSQENPGCQAGFWAMGCQQIPKLGCYDFRSLGSKFRSFAICRPTFLGPLYLAFFLLSFAGMIPMVMAPMDVGRNNAAALLSTALRYKMEKFSLGHQPSPISYLKLRRANPFTTTQFRVLSLGVTNWLPATSFVFAFERGGFYGVIASQAIFVFLIGAVAAYFAMKALRVYFRDLDTWLCFRLFFPLDRTSLRDTYSDIVFVCFCLFLQVS